MKETGMLDQGSRTLELMDQQVLVSSSWSWKRKRAGEHHQVASHDNGNPDYRGSLNCV